MNRLPRSPRTVERVSWQGSILDARLSAIRMTHSSSTTNTNSSSRTRFVEHTLAPRCFAGRPGAGESPLATGHASSPQRCWMRLTSLAPDVFSIALFLRPTRRSLPGCRYGRTVSVPSLGRWSLQNFSWRAMLAPFLLCTPMAASREHLRHQEVTAMAGAFSRFGGQGLAGSVDAQELPNFLRYVVSSMASPAAPQDQVVARSSELTEQLMRYLPAGVCGRHLLPKGARVV